MEAALTKENIKAIMAANRAQACLAEARLNKVYIGSPCLYWKAQGYLKTLRENTPGSLEHAEIYAKPWCRALCEQILNSFPLEIRGIIHAYILGNLDIVVETGCELDLYAGFPPLSFIPSGMQMSVPCYDDSLIMHCWDIQYVSGQFIQELAETWYRSACFDFGYNHGAIPAFLDSSVKDLQITPSQHFTKIVITVEMDYPNIRLERFLAAMKKLESFERHVRIIVELEAEEFWYSQTQSDLEIREFVDHCRWLHVHLCALQNAGHMIYVNSSDAFGPNFWERIEPLHKINPFPEAWEQWLVDFREAKLRPKIQEIPISPGSSFGDDYTGSNDNGRANGDSADDDDEA